MTIIDFISLTNQEQIHLLDELRPLGVRWHLERGEYHQTFQLDELLVHRSLKVDTWTTLLIQVRVEEALYHHEQFNRR